jgi:hypothetical protein
LRHDFCRAADDEQRVAADQSDLGLPVLIHAKIGDVVRHDEIVAAARFEFDKLHDRLP